jgi:hypothetical protein
MDKTRASRDGHEFHEAWAARKALQLVMPSDDLVGIAVEGLSPADQSDAADETVEIADLTLYFGASSSFNESSAVVIAQLKYSKSSEIVPFRVSNAKKTIEKFAAALGDFSKRFGVKPTNEKLTFELVTNRPIADDFFKALTGLATGAALTGDAKEQADQFTRASGFKGRKLKTFAAKLRLSGLAGGLRENKQQLSIVLADWSAAPDTMSRARLGNLKALVRDKAGLASEGRNVITRVAVLDALEVNGVDELFPCTASFPKVGAIVQREQLLEVAALVPTLTQPLLVHAEGGSGKTVFLQSLSMLLAESNKTVLFDCFGGGDYRAPEDGRHMPRRGLIHIINLLACDGLCDPLLPNHENVEDLVRAFRLRLAQAVATMRRARPGQGIVLFLDAIDNAAEHAADKHEPAFPRLLLESIHIKGPIEGVQLVVSCRTYRRQIARGEIPCTEIELKPFSRVEAEKYLRDRIKDVSDVEIDVAHSRSVGNPRILEHLALSERGLLDPSEVNNVITLDALLKERVEKALSDARKTGYKGQEINAFLAGLSVLPPPIPLEEYADAHGIDVSAVRSFSADLAPLLERTRHGLMFRDEPTETFIRNSYAADEGTLRTLAANLLKKQGASVYAASALPALLQKLNDGALLFDLAFDTRFPAAITSSVGQAHIRYNRLKAAVLYATKFKDFNRLVHLMVEMSTLAAADQRGREYLIANPDIVTAAQDVDAIRRLFEIYTRWPGTRHSRLAIANTLSSDFSNAYRHVVSADEWMRHFYDQDDEYRRDKGGPDRTDAAAAPLYYIARGDAETAMRLLRRWKDWYAFEVAEQLFVFVREGEQMGAIPTQNLQLFLRSISKGAIGVIAAALCNLELVDEQRRYLIKELVISLDGKELVEAPKSNERERGADVLDGILKSVGVAIFLGMHEHASKIISAVPSKAPSIWSLTNQYSNEDGIGFAIRTALNATSLRNLVSARSLLPRELIDIGAKVPIDLNGSDFSKALKAEVDAHYALRTDSADNNRAASEAGRQAQQFIDEILTSLYELTQRFAAAVNAPMGAAGQPFLGLIEIWGKLVKSRRNYTERLERSEIFNSFGREMLLFLLTTRDDLHYTEIAHFLQKLDGIGLPHAELLIRVVAVIAKKPTLHELAGKTAMAAKLLIERDDDVTSRASLFARLSRAIFPASSEEMGSYFRLGIEQMDAVGSGDYQFTNELLLFASQLRGQELAEPEFHTLSNLCELNMYEAHKFPWLSFAQGLSKTSGTRALARLTRWHDRDKVSLDYTMLPYLTALIDQNKIEPAIGLALLRLTDPAEIFTCGTEQLAEVIARKRFGNSKQLLSELIQQYQQNNPASAMHSTLFKLHAIASTELGADAELYRYLESAAPIYQKLSNEGNENRNYRGVIAESENHKSEREAINAQNEATLASIVLETNPVEVASMSYAVERMDAIKSMYDKRHIFFEGVRAKLKYGERSAYIRTVAALEGLGIYGVLHELKICHENWLTSSTSLKAVFHEIAIPLVQANAADLIRYDSLSGSQLEDVAKLTETPRHILVLALTEMFSSQDWNLPASIWLALATNICECSTEGEGQIALARLLNSGSAKLAATVVDGAWTRGMYPEAGEIELAAGLVWFSLGAPSAANRWRAAHSIRCLARFGKWDVIDAIFAYIDMPDASPYQAPECSFYFLHAKLWLLIAIARIAIDYPAQVSKHVAILMGITTDVEFPHVLMRHFAAATLLTCVRAGEISLSEMEIKALKNVDKSPSPLKRVKKYAENTFYQQRPASMPEPVPEFHLDYDFSKTEITSVGNMFDRSRWETSDALTAWVRKFDSKITSMHVSGGHSAAQREHFSGMKSRFHTYGQYLACHALMLVAGDFLEKYPVVLRPYGEEDKWAYWLGKELLTRDDGLWLSDGVVPPPLDSQVNLLVQGTERTELTSDVEKILSLLKIDQNIGTELVVAGDWRSSDGINIHVASALAPSHVAKKTALKLSKKDGFEAWLPNFQIYRDGAESLDGELYPFEAWVAASHDESDLDEADPLATNSVVGRTQFSKQICATFGLESSDPFNQIWTTPDGNVAATSEAWGHNLKYEDDSESPAERLVCRSQTLTNVLSKKQTDLIILVKLRRYEKGYGHKSGEFWHTVGVLRVDSAMNFEYYPGEANKLHASSF